MQNLNLLLATDYTDFTDYRRLCFAKPKKISFYLLNLFNPWPIIRLTQTKKKMYFVYLP